MQFLQLVDSTLLRAAGASIAVLLLMWVFVRRRHRVAAPQGMLVLPNVDMAPPRRRMAHGSEGFPGTLATPRSRSLRPTHAGNLARRAL